MFAGDALGTRWMGAICALSVGIFVLFSDRIAQSHIVEARPTHWELLIFCQSVFRAHQHVGYARTALCQGQIQLLCITWLPVEGARQLRATRLPCAA